MMPLWYQAAYLPPKLHQNRNHPFLIKYQEHHRNCTLYSIFKLDTETMQTDKIRYLCFYFSNCWDHGLNLSLHSLFLRSVWTLELLGFIMVFCTKLFLSKAPLFLEHICINTGGFLFKFREKMLLKILCLSVSNKDLKKLKENVFLTLCVCH